MDDQYGLPPEIIQQIKQALINDVYTFAAAKIQEYLENHSDIPLNIAITGTAGSGKSSFINAFRGMDDRDEGAAFADCVEATKEVKSYPHPNYANVTFWDLPGVGTPNFPADQYLEKVEFEKFDFFIIISESRFKENDVKLAKDIQKRGKRFYFVRSKIDNDLKGEQRMQMDRFNEQTTLDRIRDNCKKGLENEGLESPQVFLISSWEIHLYDFSRLHETLESELPDHKKHVLLMAMPNINLEIINRKKAAFQAKIKLYAFASAAGAAVPIPGLSAAVDLTLMVSVVKQYVAGFGLDSSSLQRLSASTGVPFDDLTAVVKSALAKKEITQDLILKLLIKLANISGFMAIEEGSRYIPLLGIPVAMSVSSITTYRALGFFLDELAEEAQRVFRRALGLNPSV